VGRADDDRTGRDGGAGVTCVVCGETAADHAFVARDWSLGAAPGEFRYVRCRACGTLRLDPQPDDAVLAAAYPPRYHRRGVVADVLASARDLGGRREAEALVEAAGPFGRVLDLGCGDGTFLARIRAAGWRGPLHGVEPGTEAIRAARGRGIAVEQASVETFEPRERFDLVVLRHVIEHVREPRVLLERVGAMLAPGGLAYVATPDERALSARAFGRYWHGYDPPRHLWVFRPEPLRRLHDRVGLEVVEERWDLGPEIWSSSLGYALSPAPGRLRLVASPLNPLVAVPAIGLAVAERLLRRATMYGLLSRRGVSAGG
jgi:SAM-dependent methyltransferase